MAMLDRCITRPACVLALLLLLLQFSVAVAVNKVWVGPANGPVSTGANWSPTGVPGFGDAVTIPNGVEVHVDADWTISSIFVSADADLVVDSPRTLYLTDTGSVFQSNGSRSVTIQGPSGQIQVTTTGTVEVLGHLRVDAAFLQNGAVLLRDGGRVTGVGLWTIGSTGVLDWQLGGDLAGAPAISCSGTFSILMDAAGPKVLGADPTTITGPTGRLVASAPTSTMMIEMRGVLDVQVGAEFEARLARPTGSNVNWGVFDTHADRVIRIDGKVLVNATDSESIAIPIDEGNPRIEMVGDDASDGIILPGQTGGNVVITGANATCTNCRLSVLGIADIAGPVILDPSAELYLCTNNAEILTLDPSAFAVHGGGRVFLGHYQFGCPGRVNIGGTIDGTGTLHVQHQQFGFAASGDRMIVSNLRLEAGTRWDGGAEGAIQAVNLTIATTNPMTLGRTLIDTTSDIILDNTTPGSIDFDADGGFRTTGMFKTDGTHSMNVPTPAIALLEAEEILVENAGVSVWQMMVQVGSKMTVESGTLKLERAVNITYADIVMTGSAWMSVEAGTLNNVTIDLGTVAPRIMFCPTIESDPLTLADVVVRGGGESADVRFFNQGILGLPPCNANLRVAGGTRLTLRDMPSTVVWEGDGDGNGEIELEAGAEIRVDNSTMKFRSRTTSGFGTLFIEDDSTIELNIGSGGTVMMDLNVINYGLVQCLGLDAIMCDIKNYGNFAIQSCNPVFNIYEKLPGAFHNFAQLNVSTCSAPNDVVSFHMHLFNHAGAQLNHLDGILELTRGFTTEPGSDMTMLTEDRTHVEWITPYGRNTTIAAGTLRIDPRGFGGDTLHIDVSGSGSYFIEMNDTTPDAIWANTDLVAFGSGPVFRIDGDWVLKNIDLYGVIEGTAATPVQLGYVDSMDLRSEMSLRNVVVKLTQGIGWSLSYFDLSKGAEVHVDGAVDLAISNCAGGLELDSQDGTGAIRLKNESSTLTLDACNMPEEMYLHASMLVDLVPGAGVIFENGVLRLDGTGEVANGTYWKFTNEVEVAGTGVTVEGGGLLSGQPRFMCPVVVKDGATLRLGSMDQPDIRSSNNPMEFQSSLDMQPGSVLRLDVQEYIAVANAIALDATLILEDAADWILAPDTEIPIAEFVECNNFPAPSTFFPIQQHELCGNDTQVDITSDPCRWVYRTGTGSRSWHSVWDEELDEAQDGRIDHIMTIDEARNRMIVYGGELHTDTVAIADERIAIDLDTGEYSVVPVVGWEPDGSRESTSVRVGEKWYVAGGYDPWGGKQAVFWVMDLADENMTMTNLAALTWGTRWAPMVVYNNSIWLVHGDIDGSCADNRNQGVWRYDIAGNTWTNAATLVEPRLQPRHAVSHDSGVWYWIGGSGASCGKVDTVMAIDMSNNSNITSTILSAPTGGEHLWHGPMWYLGDDLFGIVLGEADYDIAGAMFKVYNATSNVITTHCGVQEPVGVKRAAFAVTNTSRVWTHGGQPLQSATNVATPRIATLVCSAGRFRDAETGECELCEPGSANNQPLTETCSLCPETTFTNEYGKVECDSCPGGTFGNTTGMIACNTCPVAHYCASGTADPTPCPAGRYSTTDGQADISACTECAAGTANNNTAATSCDACPVGYAAPNVGMIACEPCNPGTISTTTGTVSCTDCLVGQEQPLAGQNACDDCPLGHFAPVAGTVSCTPCPAGQISALTGMSVCTQCPAGMAQNATGQTACDVCPAGTYAPAPGNADCTPCASGYVSNLVQATSCTVCPSTQYSDSEGGTECIDCPANSQALNEGASKVTDCECLPDFYEPDGKSGRPCDPCPVGGVCEGGTLAPYAQPGFWADPGNPQVFLQCSSEDACPGGNAGTCDPKYTGKLCGECAEKHYPLSGKCVPCPKDDTAKWVLISMMFAFMVTMLIAALKSGVNFASAAISFSFFQVTSVFGSMDVPWPGPVLDMFNIFSALNFNMDLASPECSMKVTYAGKWLASMSMPIVVGVLFITCLSVYAVVTKVKEVLVRQTAGRKGAAGADEDSVDTSRTPLSGNAADGAVSAKARRNGAAVSSDAATGSVAQNIGSSMAAEVKGFASFRTIINYMVQGYLTFLAFAYLYLSSRSVEVFKCTEQSDGTYSFDAYPSMDCYSQEWADLVPYAIAGSVVYAVGIPIFFLIFLWLNRKRLEDENFNQQAGFLYGRYEADTYYWEVLVMMRKLVFAMLPTLLDDPIVQTNLGLITLFIFVMLQTYFTPFDWVFHDRLEFSLLIVDLIVLFGGILFSSGMLTIPDTINLSWFLIVVLAFGLLLITYINVTDMIEQATENAVAKKLFALLPMIAQKSILARRAAKAAARAAAGGKGGNKVAKKVGEKYKAAKEKAAARKQARRNSNLASDVGQYRSLFAMAPMIMSGASPAELRELQQDLRSLLTHLERSKSRGGILRQMSTPLEADEDSSLLPGTVEEQ